MCECVGSGRFAKALSHFISSNQIIYAYHRQLEIKLTLLSLDLCLSTILTNFSPLFSSFRMKVEKATKIFYLCNFTFQIFLIHFKLSR